MFGPEPIYGTHVADCLVEGTGQRAPLARPYRSFQRGAGGSRTHLKLLCRQPPCRLAPAPHFSVLARNRTWSTTFARSRANPAHPEDFFSSAPPRNRTPSCRFVVCRAIRYTCRASVSTRNRTWIWTFGGSYAIPCTIETFSVPTWSRTRARALGEPCAIRYTIGTIIQGADGWICTSIDRFTGPAPRCSATSAFRVSSRSARIRTPSDGFGGHLLSQEHTPVLPPALRPGAFGVTTTLAALPSSTLR